MSVLPACQNGHSSPRIAVWCPECNEFILMSGGHYQRRPRLGAPLALLIFSGLAAIFLFRSSETIWTAYAFTALALIHLYAVIFSRGAALLTVSLVTTLLVICWAAGLAWTRSDLITSGSVMWIPAGIWIVCIVYAIVLGLTTSISTVRFRATYVLGSMAFIIGLWLVVAIQFDNGLGYPALLDFLILACAVVPLLFILAAVGYKGVNSIAAYFVIISAYLSILHPLVDVLTQTLTVFLPNALDVVQPVHRPDPTWLSLLRWKSAISAIAGVAAVVLVLGTSVAEVAKSFQASRYGFLAESLSASRQRLSSPADPFTRIAEQASRTALKAARTIYLMAVFIMLAVKQTGQTLFELARELLRAMWTAVRYVAAPVLCFSVISVVLVVVLYEMNAYNHGGGFSFSTWALWGGLTCVAALALLLTAASLGFAPLARGHQSLSLNGTGPAGLALGAFWIFFSLVSITMWPLEYALHNIGVNAGGLKFGSLLLSNVLMMSGIVILLMLLVLPSAIRQRSQGPNQKFITVSLLSTVAGFIVVAILLGIQPMTHWITELTS